MTKKNISNTNEENYPNGSLTTKMFQNKIEIVYTRTRAKWHIFSD